MSIRCKRQSKDCGVFIKRRPNAIQDFDSAQCSMQQYTLKYDCATHPAVTENVKSRAFQFLIHCNELELVCFNCLHQTVFVIDTCKYSNINGSTIEKCFKFISFRPLCNV